MDFKLDLDLDPSRTRQRFVAGRAENGIRIDRALVARFPGYSRSKLQKLAKDGFVKVNGRKIRPGRLLKEGELVTIALEQPTHPYALPENIPLDIIHEDSRLIVVNKPANLTVHPGTGERRGTLANALSYHFGELSQVQGPMRPGIVHRLDKNTTGLIVVAKDDDCHRFLADQFKERTVHKTYLAVVHGVVELDADLVSFPLGRDIRRPQRMAVRYDIGRTAESYYEVKERFQRHSVVEVHPRSGRTHQIRVHMATLDHPIVCDYVYGTRDAAYRRWIERHALHAWRIEFTHPDSNRPIKFEAPIPPDMERLLEWLRGGGDAAPPEAPSDEEMDVLYAIMENDAETAAEDAADEEWADDEWSDDGPDDDLPPVDEADEEDGSAPG